LLPLMSVRGTRYITTARGDIEKALTMMQATNEFYHEHFGTPCSEKLMAADLKHGIAYWCGRDSELRPILVFRANRIPAHGTRQEVMTKLSELSLSVSNIFFGT